MVADKAARPAINRAKVSKVKVATSKARVEINKAKAAIHKARVDNSRAEKVVRNKVAREAASPKVERAARRAARADHSRAGKAVLGRAAKVDQAVPAKAAKEDRAGLVRAEVALADRKLGVKVAAVDPVGHKAAEEAAAPG